MFKLSHLWSMETFSVWLLSPLTLPWSVIGSLTSSVTGWLGLSCTFPILGLTSVISQGTQVSFREEWCFETTAVFQGYILLVGWPFVSCPFSGPD